MSIRKVKGGYRVVAHSGRSMGTYASRKQAVKRLREVEYFKRHPKKGKR